MTFEDEVPTNLQFDISVLNIDRVKDEILRDKSIKQLMHKLPSTNCSTSISPDTRDKIDSFISSVGYDRKSGKVKPEKVLMILKKEMIKFILTQQLKNYNEEINPEKIILELSEVSQNYEEIIANDFDVFHD